MTHPWLETSGVLLLATGGLLAGWWFGHRRSAWWMTGYFVPLLLILAIGLARCFPRLELVQPFTWMMAGRREFAFSGVVITMILATLLPRIPARRDRYCVGALMALGVLVTAVPPFLAPVFHRSYFQALVPCGRRSAFFGGGRDLAALERQLVLNSAS